MLVLPLDDGVDLLLDSEDYPLISGKRVYCITFGSKKYPVVKIKTGASYKNVYLGRYLLGDPPRRYIEYLDGNPFNNCRTNLKCTRFRRYPVEKCFPAYAGDRFLGYFSDQSDVKYALDVLPLPVAPRRPRQGRKVYFNLNGRRLYLGTVDDPRDAELLLDITTVVLKLGESFFSTYMGKGGVCSDWSNIKLHHDLAVVRQEYLQRQEYFDSFLRPLLS